MKVFTPKLWAATAADAADLAALQTGSFDAPWSAIAIARTIDGADGFAIAVGEQPPDGFALARANGDEAEILILVVRPEMRRLGIGQALALAAADVAAARGARRLYLEVADDNLGARALYERLGFVEMGVRRGYYRRNHGEAVDARVMRLTL